jgi:hypothetical protein
MKLGFYRTQASWLAGLAAALLLLAGCTVAQPGSQTNSQSNRAGDQSTGIHIQGESDRLVMGTPEQMCTAPLVMSATISTLGPGHWNGPGHARPPTKDIHFIMNSGYAIYTPLHFLHTQIYVDNRHQPQRTTEYATIGGTVPPDSYDMGYAQVEPKGSYLLTLVPGSDPVAHAWTETVYLVNDAFPIDAQGNVILQPPHTEGKGQQTQNFPAVTMPLTQLAQQLASCK